MKKTYINPAMDIVEIKAANQLLAGSVTLNGDLGISDPILAPEFDDFDLTDTDVTDFDNF